MMRLEKSPLKPWSDLASTYLAVFRKADLEQSEVALATLWFQCPLDLGDFVSADVYSYLVLASFMRSI